MGPPITGRPPGGGKSGPGTKSRTFRCLSSTGAAAALGPGGADARVPYFQREPSPAPPDAGGKRRLIVTHDAVVLILRLILDHLDENVLADSVIDGRSVGSIGNCSVTRWVGEGAQMRLDAYNDAEHLMVLNG